MFNIAWLLTKKRELLTASIHTYNARRLWLITRPGMHAMKSELNEWKHTIEKFNVVSRHNSRDGLIGNGMSPELLASNEEFLDAVNHTHRLTTWLYLIIGLSGLLSICFLGAVIPEIYLLTIWLPGILLGILSWAIMTSMFCDPQNPVIVGQAFDAEELENLFQGSDFEKLISHLSPYTPEFIKNYPSPKFRKILASMPKTLLTLDLEQAEFDKLPSEYLIQLADALPSITTLEVNPAIISRMSFEQLDALARMVPNATRIVTHNEDRPEKIQYLQSRINSNFQTTALKVIHALSQLEKGRPSPSGVPTNGTYPSDVINHISKFFHGSQSIRNGINTLRNNELNTTTQSNPNHSDFVPG